MSEYAKHDQSTDEIDQRQISDLIADRLGRYGLAGVEKIVHDLEAEADASSEFMRVANDLEAEAIPMDIAVNDWDKLASAAELIDGVVAEDNRTQKRLLFAKQLLEITKIIRHPETHDE